MEVSKPRAYPNTNSKPTWSPDGQKIMADVGSQTIVVERENPEQQDVFSQRTTWVNFPDWNPKGERVAFSAHTPPSEGEKPSWGIYTCNEEGGDFKRILDNARKAEFNPQGDKIAYHATDKRSGTFIGVANADGSQPHKVGVEGRLQNSWSWDPQGHQLAYETFKDGEFQIRVTDFTGKKDRLLSNGHSGQYWIKTPQWSPDGDKILFERHERLSPKSSLVTVDVNTREELQVSHMLGRTYDASWSPDGTQIAFVANKDNLPRADVDLFVMDADGKNVKKLSGLKGDEHAPVWSPDGKAIAFMHLGWEENGNSTTNLHVIELGDQ